MTEILSSPQGDLPIIDPEAEIEFFFADDTPEEECHAVELFVPHISEEKRHVNVIVANYREAQRRSEQMRKIWHAFERRGGL